MKKTRTKSAMLVCWHSQGAGLPVVENTVTELRQRGVSLDQILYLVQENQSSRLPTKIGDTPLDSIQLDVGDPTNHESLYRLVRDHVCPLMKGEVHINVSPGTPAMHAVWLVLHAGGAFPDGTHLWSSQFDPKSKSTRLDVVEFSLSTYLAEVRHVVRQDGTRAAYCPEAHSPARRAALEKLLRYARVKAAPLLILGERGTGKTRLVETFVAAIKQRKVVTLACGGLDSSLAESLLFGHCKGAFTGASVDRQGLLAEADKGILFLDEVQDLPASAQRKLVRVLQDRHRRYRPLGSDQERSTDVELVCASNLDLHNLRQKLDADLFDRISHLLVHIPPLRECVEDWPEDWQHVWQEMHGASELCSNTPWSEAISQAFRVNGLPGNLRDFQRFALLLAAWNDGPDISDSCIEHALAEWLARAEREAAPSDDFGRGSRTERGREFHRRLARWAKQRWKTWSAAANALECDEKTLRNDARE